MKILIALLGSVLAPTVFSQSNSVGEVVFNNGKTKSFVQVASVFKKPVDFSTLEIRYSRNLEEFFSAGLRGRDRMPKMSLRGVQRIDLVQYSSEEKATIKKIGSGCVNTDACTYRKVILTFKNGKKESGIYIDLGSSPRYAVGPEKEYYDLADYDIAAIVLR